MNNNEELWNDEQRFFWGDLIKVVATGQVNNTD